MTGAGDADERGYVFLLSHMRGHTTLLAYLLASHPEIDGHVEQHRPYETRGDLVAMRARIEKELGAPVRGRWLLDKLLHNRLVVAPAILARRDVRVIAMARHPAATIASQVRRSRTHPHVAQYADPARAARYYVLRIRGLLACAGVVGDRCRYVSAERLVGDPAATLAPLAPWLRLATPIPTRYRVFEPKPGLGDTSPHIQAGRVLGDDERPAVETGPIDIPPAALAEAVAAWQDVTEAFTGTRPPPEPPSQQE